MEMSGTVQGWSQALMADPDTVRRDVVIIGKDHPRRHVDDPSIAPGIPGVEGAEELQAGVLMMPTGLSRHVELSVNNLVALAIIRQDFQVC
jgi:hypothetical protein